ncbi:DUF2975 domain-containing protein [Tetragenococcus koreensis]|uniref:DUF2975 domain-containing protein n=1 Tax=Tetragenococcus koreensis TaxID=290335 RepID=UPI000F4F1211|nr:DUF2975 domain-containing protein [Tetragenococcus koreensis]AYW46388.1 hypothetical protein C7K43_10885 [Tetragenococcus koreensis]GEN91508.1 hypothetical protein TKO01_15540 [Tetragenococcus koreensis]
MNPKTKLALKFLSILIVVAEIIFAFLSILLVLGIFVLAIPTLRNYVDVQATINGQIILLNNLQPSLLFVIGGLIFGLLLIGTLFYIVNALKNIITNMEYMNFFTKDNLRYSKKILSGLWIIIAEQIVAIVISLVTTFYTKSGGNLNFDLTYLFVSFVFLAVFYTIYTLFKNGMELKNENDSFI